MFQDGGRKKGVQDIPEVTVQAPSKDFSNLSLEQRQQAYDDSASLYNLGTDNKTAMEILRMWIDGETDDEIIDGRFSTFESDKERGRAATAEEYDRLMRLNGFIKGDLREEKLPTTGDLYKTAKWEEYSNYNPKS